MFHAVRRRAGKAVTPRRDARPMDVVLPGVAVASAVIATLSWRASRRAADAAAQVAGIDAERRHEERAPRFSARFGRALWTDAHEEIGGVDVVWFDYLSGPPTLTKVSVELMTRAEGRPQAISRIADSETEAWGQRIDSLYPFDLDLGKEPVILVERGRRAPSGDAVFLLTCHAGAAEWVIPVRCEIPEPSAATGVVQRHDARSA